MRRSSPLVPLVPRLRLAALLTCAVGACNPALQPDDLSGSQGDDAAPDAALYWGDDGGGGGDDAFDATAPGWDASAPDPGDDAAVPEPSGDEGAAMPVEGGPPGACGHGLGPGDLLVDELMIESVAGAGDDGEWLEIANTAGCAVNLRGLHGECPVGSKVHTFDVTEDLWVPAGATFVIADSVDPAVNHDLPGVVLAWAGHGGDILRNLGGTVTLRSGEALVDSVTWPSLKPAVGVSVELPADCPASDGVSFDAWQPAFASWFPGFHGTPNAPNDDVSCP